MAALQMMAAQAWYRRWGRNYATPTAMKLVLAAVVLSTLNDIDISGLDPRLKDCVIRVACDVTNPLVGDNGASRIFGPQKWSQ